MKHSISRLLPFMVGFLLAVAVGSFYFFLYPYHLHFYEQMQMFQFSTGYFLETVMLPGGLVDYLGRFLTQFFHITSVGALIMALLFGGVYLTSWLVVGEGLTGRNRLLWSLLSLLPVRFLWVNACDENAMPDLYLALIISLLSVWAFRHMTVSATMRRLSSLLYYPLLYFAVGPLSVTFAMLLAIHEFRQTKGMRWFWGAGLLLLAGVVPAIAHHWVLWPYENLYLGLHYFRFTYIQLPYIWEAVVVLVLIAIIAPVVEKRWRNRQSISIPVVGLGALGLMIVLIWAGVNKAYRPNNEVAMMYDDLVLNERWEDILHEASIRTPKHPACVQCINLAMAMTGRMGDLLFRCPQPGADALLPKFNINFSRPLTAGQIYLSLGWTNTAQRYVYEANESIPDYQKSSHCYKLLAQTHIARGDKALARKYLKKLQHTLFYSDWANEQLSLLADPDPKTLAHHPKYGPLMNGAVRDDYFFGPDVLAMLGNYCTTTPHNRVATQYLLALSLVTRHLDTFVGCYELSQYLDSEDRIPEYWQQALALDWWLKHGSFEGEPHHLDERVMQGLQQFMSDREAGLPLEQRYYFTYWYYHFSGEQEAVADEAATAAPN